VTESLPDLTETKRAIREKVVQLARRRGVDATNVKDSELIPESGALDSVGILELIIWAEMTFGVTIPQSDLTVENVGTIDAMATYLHRQ
jgi:acyl carrier protein